MGDMGNEIRLTIFIILHIFLDSSCYQGRVSNLLHFVLFLAISLPHNYSVQSCATHVHCHYGGTRKGHSKMNRVMQFDATKIILKVTFWAHKFVSICNLED
jgi:hypothetical protein